MKLPQFSFLRKNKSPEILEASPIGIIDIIAPSSIEVKPDCLRIGDRFARTYFIFSYPRYLNVGWISPILNLDIPIDVSFYIDPIDTGMILKKLRNQIADIEAELMEREQKGLVRDPKLDTAYKDTEAIRDSLSSGEERMFNFGLYITIYGASLEELNKIELNLRSILESRLNYIKMAYYQQREGFSTTAPWNSDNLINYTALNTGSLSTCFPFISFDLSSNEGILYGINKHNNSLVIFDRFSLPNANSVIFATAGSGKSYHQKLEILRYLMMGVDVIIIDPENEYKFLAEAVGGSFFNISLSSNDHVNPFDLPPVGKDEKPEDVLRSNIISLVGLMRLMLGGLTPQEDAIIDTALTEVYAAKDITPSSDPTRWKENIPLMSDLEAVLETMEGAESLLDRIRKFSKGTSVTFFNQYSNVSLNNNLVAFGIRDMEDSLRPIAMYMVMKYIWSSIKTELKKRILVVDEAWWFMQNEDSASFLFGIVKRARKYWLGVSTITQDVEDFMKSEYGKPIITNSSLIFLMKQSSAGIDMVQQAFNLTNEEKYLLLESSVGEGIFFAGQKHIALRVVGSYAEHQFITTSPEEVKKILEAKKSLNG
ncbi:MAG TPA: DUF87 domain-containing protein [Candidatus Pacearchaeota archaeon]|nr:DUF87 domain-containing protein [Candidatus Pacearchaeota archaeon]